MHEMPVVLSAVEYLDNFADKNDIQNINEVVMQIGEIAPVIPKYFEKYWQLATERSRHLQHTVLYIEIIPGIAKCDQCGHEFNIENYNGICPECHYRYWKIISGKEVGIKEIHL